MCYSPVGSDARVTNQIRWFEAAGYRVDILSREPEHPDATGRRFRIGYPPLWVRLIVYFFLRRRARFRSIVGRHLPVADLTGRTYDIVLVNDLQLLPWAVEAIPALAGGPVVLDLHEVYADNGTSLFYRLLMAPYDDWLLTFISSPVFTKRLTVAEGIADLYRDQYGVPRPGVIRNVAPYEELEPSPVDPERILLEHHGYAAVERGVDLMLAAALQLEPRFTLVLMVLGDQSEIAAIRRHPATVAGRVQLRDPVPVTEVAKAVNDCDLEVIFFPPRFGNNTYALPNKFFESIQGRLGVVIGNSPEIVPFVRDYGLGVVVDGWTASDLAATINSLSVDDIVALKQASDRAASELSTRGERDRFLTEVGA
jgi:glycosyltransferase involved in cell wall biosynthesis